MLTIRYETLDVGPQDLVLDLGCGAGRHSYEAARWGSAVVAVDMDAGVLKQVRDVAASFVADEESAGRPIGSIACAAGDGLRLPFPDGSFDRAIVSEVLEHIEHDEAALAEVARVVRLGGAIAVSVPRAWPERICWMLSRQYHSNAGGHVRIYRRGQLLAKIRRAGFEVAASHHAHALHTPYWWLRCAVGSDREDHRLVKAYHRLLVWDIERKSPPVRLLERAANPVIGKSLVVYARKAGPS